MKKIIFVVIGCLLLLIGCVNKASNNNSNTEDVNNSIIDINDTKESDIEMNDIKVIINDEIYTLKLENNNTVEEFINLLPQEFTMNELNGNEKYVYIDESLPTNLIKPNYINAGDVMLYGNNCIVIFYKLFNTSYSYTKIGHINNFPDLGDGNIKIKFER